MIQNRLLAVLSLYGCFLSLNLQAAHWYVSATGTPTGSATSWQTANSDLQAVINTTVTGDTIWAMYGTYIPSRDASGNIPTNNRNRTFVLKDGVVIIGGFTGTESSVGERNPATDSMFTTLSGSTYNCYHVVTAIGTATAPLTTTLDKIRITRGKADGAAGTNEAKGAGFFARYATIKLIKCNIRKNDAKLGAGLYLYKSIFKINSCSFEYNSNSSISERGCVLYSDTSNVTIYHSTSSYSGYSGSFTTLQTVEGGIFYVKGGALYVYGSILLYGNAQNGSVAFVNNGLGAFVNCTISGNYVYSTIAVRNIITSDGAGATVSIQNSIVKGNLPNTGSGAIATVATSGGGGMVLSNSIVQGAFPGAVDGNVMYKPSSGWYDLECSATNVAINAGDTAFLPSDIFDMDRDGDTTEMVMYDRTGIRPRVTGSSVDLGVYESLSGAPVFPHMYVNGQAPAGGDGSSWATAMQQLSLVLGTLACNGGSASQIWVAEGTYAPGMSNTYNGGAFTLPAGTALYGGFAGTETLLSERDAALHPTILSGDQQRDNHLPNNVPHVLVISNGDSTTRVDGFVIKDGYIQNTSNINYWNWGSGISIENTGTASTVCSPVITHCTFPNALNGAISVWGGAGVTKPVIQNCRISQFTDGGIIINNGAGTCEVKILKDTIENQTNANFGAISLRGTLGIRALIDSCYFKEINKGVLWESSSDSSSNIKIINSIFYKINYGCYFDNNFPSNQQIELEIKNCRFLNLKGLGAIKFNSSNINTKIINCNFNKQNDNNYGGVAAIYGILYSNVNLYIFQSTFSEIESMGNNAAGIDLSTYYSGSGVINISNNTFYKNTAKVNYSLSNGAAIRLIDNSNQYNIEIYNNIFKDNIAILQGYPPSTITNQYVYVQTSSSATPIFSHNLCDQTFPGIAVGNTIGSAIFSNPTAPAGADSLWGTADDGLHLACYSPGDSVGLVTVLSAGDTLDCVGAPRIQNRGLNAGAYETILPNQGVTRLYVKPGTNGQLGTSWAQAFNDLQQAIDEGKACASNAFEIWMSAGTYLPTKDLTGNPAPADPRSTTFSLPKDATLYGGFNGTETTLATRNPAINKTILSGDRGVGGDAGDNCYHILYSPYGNTLDGVIISGGNANGGAVTAQTGGGIWFTPSQSATFTLRNSIVAKNSAVFGGGIGITPSGGISHARFLIENSLLTQDSAGLMGGGIYLNSDSGTVCLNVRNATLAGNHAQGVGGGAIAASNTIGSNDSILIGNSILWANGMAADSLLHASIASISVQHTCATGASSLVGTANTNADPQFSNVLAPAGIDGIWGTPDDGLHLTCFSPANNTGSNLLLPAVSADLAGQPRIQRATVNMGAYETLKTTSHTRLYVAANGTGQGTSWADASPDLGEVLYNSGCAVNVSEIWIADGTYLPTSDSMGNTTPADPRNKVFFLRNGVSLYGGFAGGETTLAARPPMPSQFASNTILSGNIGIAGDSTDNSYHVLQATNLTATTRLDRLVIEQGVGAWWGIALNGQGGGLLATGSNIEVSSCTFRHNYATLGGGGAVYSTGNTLFTGCLFEHNTANDDGGAIYTAITSNTPITSIFKKCLFIGNKAQSDGGAVHTFGGTWLMNTTRLLGCGFLHNQATTGWGGAVSVEAGYNRLNNTTIQNSIFYHNSALTSKGGEAIAFRNDPTNVIMGGEVANCSFYGNGGINNGGSVIDLVTGWPFVASPTDDPLVKNCIFKDNYAWSLSKTSNTIGYTTQGNVNAFNNIIDFSGISLYPPNPATVLSLVNVNDPDGADNLWFTTDDGLALANCSLNGIDALPSAALSADTGDLDADGNTAELLPIDITGGSRILGAGLNHGAYEYVDPTPVSVSINSPGTFSICAKDSVSLTATGAVSYAWTAGIQNGVPFAPAATQTYTVTATGYNSCTVKDSVTIQVNTSALIMNATASAGGVCPGGAVALHAVSNAPVSWSHGVQDNVFFTPTSTQTYSAITSAGGCADTAMVTIQVWPLPGVSIQASDSVLCGVSLLTLNGTGAVSYSWTGGITDGVPFTAIFGNTYVVTGVDSNGCSASASFSPVVSPLPAFSFTASDSVICEGQFISISATSAPGVALSWPGTISPNVPFAPVTGTSYPVSATDIVSGCVSDTVFTPTIYPLPILNLPSSADSVCAGDAVTLSATTNAAAIAWSGGVVNGVAFQPTGSSVYVATATSAQGCVATDSTVLTVFPSPALALVASDSVICWGDSISLFGSSSSGASVGWSGGIANGVFFAPGSSGAYTAIATSSNGCTATDSIIVTVNALPLVSITISDDSICAGAFLALAANAPNTASLSWSNNVSNGVAFIPGVGAVYTVVATDSNGCVDSASFAPTIFTNPLVTAIASDDSVCRGDNISVTAIGALTHLWVGNITSNVPFAPDTTATYFVIGVDANGCLDSAQVTVVVTDPGLALATLPPGGVCAGNPVLLDAYSAAPFAWNHGVVNQVPFVPVQSQVYTAISSLNGCSDTLSIPVAVWNTPDPIITATAPDSLTILGLPGIIAYQWSMNGQPLPDTTASIILLTPGSYAVTVTSADGCTGTSLPFLYTTKDADGQVQGKMYPNPATERVMLEHAAIIQHIQIYDMQGRNVWSQQLLERQNIIQIEINLPEGVYQLRVNDGEANYRLIVQ